jgi:hypothetical protein
MAASSSRQPPQEIPLLPSPVTASKPQVRKDKGKGKAKERDVATRGRAESSKNSGDQPVSAWPWVSLTESAASNHPPVFTKDGRYDCLSQPLMNCSRNELT